MAAAPLYGARCGVAFPMRSTCWWYAARQEWLWKRALEHVSKEIRHSNPAVSVALAKLLDELLVLPDRREAFRNFGNRTGIDGARRLATMLGQSMQYGTPLSQVLRTIAVDLRRERITRAGNQGRETAGIAGHAADFVHHAVDVHRSGGAGDAEVDGHAAHVGRGHQVGPTRSLFNWTIRPSVGLILDFHGDRRQN